MKGKPVPPGRKPDAAYRTRKYITEPEFTRLHRAAGLTGRHRHRDRAILWAAYRHGLRVSELIDLRWSQIDFELRVLHVRRLKHGAPSTHPIGRTELAALRRLRRPDGRPEDHVFMTERSGPLTVSTVQKLVKRAGVAAGLGPAIHPHMLRHGCGFYLGAQGTDTKAIQAYLGHRTLAQTIEYVALSPQRFNGFWRD